MCAQRRLRPVWPESSLSALWVAKEPSFLQADSEDWSDWADAQADLSLRWAHMPFCWFCHDAAHFVIYRNVQAFGPGLQWSSYKVSWCNAWWYITICGQKTWTYKCDFQFRWWNKIKYGRTHQYQILVSFSLSVVAEFIWRDEELIDSFSYDVESIMHHKWIKYASYLNKFRNVMRWRP